MNLTKIQQWLKIPPTVSIGMLNSAISNLPATGHIPDTPENWKIFLETMKSRTQRLDQIVDQIKEHINNQKLGISIDALSKEIQRLWPHIQDKRLFIVHPDGCNYDNDEVTYVIIGIKLDVETGQAFLQMEEIDDDT